MNNIQKRFILFLFGCIVIRSLFVYISYKYTNFLPLFGILALIPVIGWLNILFFNPRETGPEVFGEKIWWKNIRIIHMLLYFLFAILALTSFKKSWVILLIDVCIGLLAFLIHHYSVGDFKLLV